MRLTRSPVTAMVRSHSHHQARSGTVLPEPSEGSGAGAGLLVGLQLHSTVTGITIFYCLLSFYLEFKNCGKIDIT